MKIKEQDIRYLNLDVELESEYEISLLLDHLGEEVFILSNEQVDSIFYTSFEPKYFETDTPELHAQHILGLLENLPETLRKMWAGCRTKIFDFGFDCGVSPRPFFTDLSPETLQGIAEIGATVRITLYPTEYAPDKEAIRRSPKPLSEE